MFKQREYWKKYFKKFIVGCRKMSDLKKKFVFFIFFVIIKFYFCNNKVNFKN